jgi:hypothetical protein
MESLLLSCRALSSPTTCRFIPAHGRPRISFTELGVAMLSSVLNSERAVRMNMTILRAFVKLREMTAHNRDIAVRLEKLERSHARAASVIEVLVEDIDQLAGDVKQMRAIPASTRRRIGFRQGAGE